MSSPGWPQTQTFLIPLSPNWGYGTSGTAPGLSLAQAEEFTEVFESILNSLRTQPDDPDAQAACWHLLRHLAASAPG